MVHLVIVLCLLFMATLMVARTTMALVAALPRQKSEERAIRGEAWRQAWVEVEELCALKGVTPGGELLPKPNDLPKPMRPPMTVVRRWS